MKEEKVGFYAKSQKPSEGKRFKPIKMVYRTIKLPKDLKSTNYAPYSLHRGRPPSWVETNCVVCKMSFMNRTRKPKQTCSKTCHIKLTCMNNTLRSGKPIYYVKP